MPAPDVDLAADLRVAEVSSGGWPCCRGRAGRLVSTKIADMDRRRVPCPPQRANGPTVAAPSVRTPSRSQCARTSVPAASVTSLSRQKGPTRTPVAQDDHPSRITSTSISTFPPDVHGATDVDPGRVGEARSIDAQRAHRAQLERALQLRELPRVVSRPRPRWRRRPARSRGIEFGAARTNTSVR